MATESTNGKRDVALRAQTLPQERGFENVESPGLLVGGVGLAAWGLWKRGVKGIFYTGLGAGLLYQWMKTNEIVGGHTARRLLNTKSTHTTHVRAAITVDQPIEAVYRRWRRLEELPAFMEHIESVEELDSGHSRWTAVIPKTHERISWTAETVEDVPQERIVWRSIEGSDVHNEGIVEFRRGPHENQTEIVATIGYRAPAGKVGAQVLEFLRAVPRQFVKEDLRNFKQMVETGELPTTEGQPTGRDMLH